MQKLIKTRIGLFLVTYLIFVLLFIIQKPVFMLFNSTMSSDIVWQDWFRVMLAGLPMDFSVAGYFTVVPGVILLISVFSVKYLKKILNIYFIIVSIFISIIFIPDVELYSFWGFRIDSTVLNYITTPVEAVASVPVYVTILICLIIFVYTALQYLLLRKCIVNNFPEEVSGSKLKTAVVLILLLGLMFIPVRGGVTTSTMNVSRVYFSRNMFLNHAAINPVFNMFYSMKLNTDFSKEYNFMEDDKAHGIFNSLMAHDENTEIPQLLNTDRPDILFIILESFGAQIIEPLGGEKNVAPNMNKLTGEGVFFKNLYASSFRTDRGIVAALAGYPAQPTMSLLKYTNKVQSLNSIPKSLIDNGYDVSFLYGGDVNFAQIKTLLVTQKITDITTDTDFPVESRLTKWGVPDAIAFEKYSKDVLSEANHPFCKIFLTLSSHEPFDVPTRKFEEPYLNSVAYTDSCIGVFIDELKASPQWKNTLVIFLPDHNMRYPRTLGHYEPERHSSFMLWIGGAVKEPVEVEKVCSQIDVAATLLSQLKIGYQDFLFSKDIFNPTSKEFAFYSFPNGFGMMSDKGKVVYDYDGKKVLLQEGVGGDSLLLQGKAFLQSLYDDIEKR